MNENRFSELKSRIRNQAVGYEGMNIAGYVERLEELEKQQIIEEAELVLKQTVVFRDILGREIGRGVHRRDEEMWNHYYETNPQWTYALNRHDFLYKLLYAYLLTGEKKYGEKLRWCIFDWMIKNPIALSGTPTTRPEDTGIRCLNWCGLILQMIEAQIIDEEDTVVYLQNMAMQFEYLKRRYVGSNTISSKGVPQTAAMCAAYLWFAEFLVQDYGLEQWAWRELRQQLELQVLEDGSHREETWNNRTEAVCRKEDACDEGQPGNSYFQVLDACGKLLLHCQNAKGSGVKLCEEAEHAMMPETGWLWCAVERMTTRLLYLADSQGYYEGWLKRGLGLLWEDGQGEGKAQRLEKKPLWFNSPDSETLYIRSDWSEAADYTWIGRRAASQHERIEKAIKPYVREKDGAYFVEMASYGMLPEESLQVSKVMALPGGIWMMSTTQVSLERDVLVKNVAAEDTSVEGALVKSIWTVCDGHVQMKVHSSRSLEKKCLDIQDMVILAPEEVQVKRAAVFQFGRPAPVARSLVAAWDMRLPSGELWTVVFWNRRVNSGSQMFLCHGVPICGDVAVLHGKDGGFKRMLF